MLFCGSALVSLTLIPAVASAITGTSFVSGDTVRVNSTGSPLNVRAGAGLAGTILGQQTTGATGVIQSDPSNYVNGYYWWNVNFTSGADGWVAGGSPSYAYLDKISTDTIPSAPNSPSAVALSSTNITFTWSDNATNETGFRIERNVNDGAYSFLANSGSISGSGQGGHYEDSNLTPGTKYCYKVRATNASGDSVFTGPACAVTQASSNISPTVSTGSASNISETSTKLDGWINPNGMMSGGFFQWGISVAYGNTTPNQVVGGGTSPVNISAILANLQPGTTYHYRLMGTNANPGSQVFGSDRTFTTTFTTIRMDLGVTPSETQADLVWNVYPSDVGVAGYRIYRCVGSDCVNFEQVHSSTVDYFNDFHDTGLTVDTVYRYQVSAIDTAGNELLRSSVVSVKTLVSILCTGFSYSDWSECSLNGMQSREITGIMPPDCTTGSPGTPETSRSCTYLGDTPACTGFTYSDWDACQPDRFQTRTVIGSIPTNCSGGAISQTTQSCSYTPPAQTTQCSDGIDNDGDGQIDASDPGCTMGSHNFEFSDQLKSFTVHSNNILHQSIHEPTTGLTSAINYFGSSVNGAAIDFTVDIIFKAISEGIDWLAPAKERIEQASQLILDAKDTDVQSNLINNPYLDFTVSDIESIKNQYHIIAANDSAARLRAIYFTEWMLKELDSFLLIKDAKDTVKLELNSLKALLVAELSVSTLSDLESKIDSEITQINSQYEQTISSSTTFSLPPAIFQKTLLSKRKAAIDAMGVYYSTRAGMLDTFAKMKDDWAFKSSAIAYGIGKSAADASIAGYSVMSGCATCATVAGSTFIGDLAGIAGTAWRSKEMFLLGHNILEESGIYANNRQFASDIAGAISQNTIGVLEKLQEGSTVWDTSDGKISSWKANGDENYIISVGNTNLNENREYKLTVTSTIPKTAHSLFNGLMAWNYDLPMADIYPGGTVWTPISGNSSSNINIKLPLGHGDALVNLLEKNPNGVFLADSITIPAQDQNKGWFNNMFAGKIMSPGELRVRDAEGKVTGLVDGVMIEEIPNSFYDDKNHAFVILNQQSTYTCEIKGKDTGEYGLELDAVIEGTESVTKASGVPIISGEIHEWTVNWSGLQNNDRAVILRIDKNGDGTPEKTIEAGNNFSDTTAPNTTLSVFGISGNDSWYRSDVSVSLSATDNDGGVGVKETKYSLDNGATWNVYSEPFTISDEGMHTVQYFSEDWFGNVEETKTEEIKIDKTAPVVTITNPANNVTLYGLVDIKGSVTDTNPDHYELTILDSSGAVVSGPGAVNKTDSFADEHLMDWDTTKVSDGAYTIKLEAEDAAGNKGENGITITLNNTPDNKDQCKDDGWKNFSVPKFKNQGDCVSFIESSSNAKGNKTK